MQWIFAGRLAAIGVFWVLFAVGAAQAVDAPAVSTVKPSEPLADRIAAQVRETEHTRGFLERRVAGDADDVPALNRLAASDLSLLRLTGRFEHLTRAREAARKSLAAVPGNENPSGLAVMARVEFESHRFAEARDFAVQMTKAEPGQAEGFLILGDALLELGRIDDALAAWGEGEKRGAAGLEQEVRLARGAWLHGKLDEMRDRLTRALALARSLDDPPAPATVVWCLLQRGQLAFGRGDWDGAEADYLAARQIAPGHYATLEHLAELRGAQKRFAEAESLYRETIAATERPEFVQALGDMQAFAGQTEAAKATHAQALAGYLKSVEEGNAHYYHHLAGFFCDVDPEPEKALQWARRDIEARQSAAAYDTLAWALYQDGKWSEAATAARQALAPGVRDAHLLYHAGMILSRAGDLAAGGRLLREVSAVNPRYFDTFHVHR